MNNMANKIFHGISFSHNCVYTDPSLEMNVFEDILKCRKILTREELYKTNSEILRYLGNVHQQRLNEVCLAMHPDGKYFYDETALEDAFYDFIRFHISFIFDSSSLDNRELNIFGIPGEIRLLGSLNLDDNLLGIGFFDEIEYIINEINNGKAGKYDPFYHNLKYCDDVETYVDDRKNNLYSVKEMLKKYEFNVPIVDPFSGIEINDNREEDIEKVSKILCKIK